MDLINTKRLMVETGCDWPQLLQPKGSDYSINIFGIGITGMLGDEFHFWISIFGFYFTSGIYWGRLNCKDDSCNLDS